MLFSPGRAKKASTKRNKYHTALPAERIAQRILRSTVYVIALHNTLLYF